MKNEISKSTAIEKLKTYNNRTNFQRNERNLVYYLKKMGWFDEIINSIPKNNKNKGLIWTKENCIKEAKKYKTRGEWALNNKTSYNSAQRQNIINECCEHMILINKPKKFWENINNCMFDAKKYNSRTEWSRGNSVAYNTARKNGWLDLCCSHMKIRGHKYKRQIYMFEFTDKKVYIGLTYNIERRKYSHLNDPKSPVFKHKKETKLLPKFQILSELVSVEEAKKLETYYQNKYIKLGYIPLYDTNKVGALGSTLNKWTLEKCKKMSEKYMSVKDWRLNDMASYVAAIKYGWLKDCSKHMKRYPLKYTKAECIEDAKKYTYPEEWKKNSYKHYSFSIYHKFYYECTKHMKRRR